jgi:hypothetical protein
VVLTKFEEVQERRGDSIDWVVGLAREAIKRIESQLQSVAKIVHSYQRHWTDIVQETNADRHGAEVARAKMEEKLEWTDEKLEQMNLYPRYSDYAMAVLS